MKPHKCPVCNGTGLVSRPPGVAGDVDTWTATHTDLGPFPCRACHGLGIVWEHDPVCIPSIWIPAGELEKLQLGEVHISDEDIDGKTWYTITTGTGTALQDGYQPEPKADAKEPPRKP